MGRPSDPDYWKKWRAAHPEYRARERARSQSRTRTTEQRQAERQRAAEREAIRDREYIKRWRIANPELRAEQKRRNYERHKADKVWKSVWNKRRRKAMKYLEIADEALASINLHPDHRTALGTDTYSDARGAAALAVVECKGKSHAAKLAAAVRAAQSVRRDATTRAHTTLSLDAPIGDSTEPLGHTLEGNWYL